MISGRQHCVISSMITMTSLLASGDSVEVGIDHGEDIVGDIRVCIVKDKDERIAARQRISRLFTQVHVTLATWPIVGREREIAVLGRTRFVSRLVPG